MRSDQSGVVSVVFTGVFTVISAMSAAAAAYYASVQIKTSYTVAENTEIIKFVADFSLKGNEYCSLRLPQAVMEATKYENGKSKADTSDIGDTNAYLKTIEDQWYAIVPEQKKLQLELISRHRIAVTWINTTEIKLASDDLLGKMIALNNIYRTASQQKKIMHQTLSNIIDAYISYDQQCRELILTTSENLINHVKGHR